MHAVRGRAAGGPMSASDTAQEMFQVSASAWPRSAHAVSTCLIRSAIPAVRPANTPAARAVSHVAPAVCAPAAAPPARAFPAGVGWPLCMAAMAGRQQRSSTCRRQAAALRGSHNRAALCDAVQHVRGAHLCGWVTYYSGCYNDRTSAKAGRCSTCQQPLQGSLQAHVAGN